MRALSMARLKQFRGCRRLKWSVALERGGALSDNRGGEEGSIDDEDESKMKE